MDEKEPLLLSTQTVIAFLNSTTVAPWHISLSQWVFMTKHAVKIKLDSFTGHAARPREKTVLTGQENRKMTHL